MDISKIVTRQKLTRSNKYIIKIGFMKMQIGLCLNFQMGNLWNPVALFILIKNTRLKILQSKF